MKRLNGVVLDGVLAKWQDAPKMAGIAGEDAVLGMLVSDAGAGRAGRHAVLFQARLAAEVRAFATAAGGEMLEVTVWGYLWGNTVVVADRVSFHVPAAVRAAAGRAVARSLMHETERRNP